MYDRYYLSSNILKTPGPIATVCCTHIIVLLAQIMTNREFTRVQDWNVLPVLRGFADGYDTILDTILMTYFTLLTLQMNKEMSTRGTMRQSKGSA